MTYKRPILNVFRAFFNKDHILGILRGFYVYSAPFSSLYRYIFIRPLKVKQIGVNFRQQFLFDVTTVDDLITIHEIFCRRDYAAPANASVVVDFGSNIGISGAFFHACAPSATIYLYEPDQRNLKVLKENLARLNGKFKLNEIAVTADFDGKVSFGISESGRYGGVGLETGSTIDVSARKASTVLKEIIEEHGEIDVLKIDVENLESEILASLDPCILSKVRLMFVEFPNNVRPQLEGFNLSFVGQVCRYTRGNLHSDVQK